MFGRSKRSRRAQSQEDLGERKTALLQDNFVQVCKDPAESAVICFLNLYGKYAFDLDEIKAEEVREICHEWIDHILGGSPASMSSGKRNGRIRWHEMTRFLSTQRQEESGYVTSTVSGLREVLWDFIREVSNAVSRDQDSNGEIRKKLSDLSQSARSDSIDKIREKVQDAVQFIGSLLESREQSQKEQMRQLGTRLKQMRMALVSAQRQMELDSLTQLYNRKAFDEQLERIVQLSQFSGASPALFILDGDNFKNVNDAFGHRAGDAALMRMADCCVRSFPRQSDYIARFGGDEFAVIVEDAFPEVCERMGRQLLDLVKRTPVIWEDEEIWLTASLGVALLRPEDDWASWFERADRALRTAKKLGRNQISIDFVPVLETVGQTAQGG